MFSRRRKWSLWSDGSGQHCSRPLGLEVEDPEQLSLRGPASPPLTPTPTPEAESEGDSQAMAARAGFSFPQCGHQEY